MANLAQLCRAVEGDLRGAPDLEITGVASLEGAGPGDIAPVDSDRFLKAARNSKAGALLVATALAERIDRPCILSDAPLVALNVVIEMLGLLPPAAAPGVHPTAVVDESAEIGAGCSIGAHVTVGPGARIGPGSQLRPSVVVERGVTMGESCMIEPGAVLQEGTVLHDRVRIGANAVISRQGFGYTAGPAGPVRLHHIGRVVLEDDVHVGACTMVDRARYDETRIGKGSALDNLVQVGHNCTIGSFTFLASQTGLAGNAHLGSKCEVAGQTGVGNRCGVGDRCRIGGGSGVTKMWGDDVELLGYPAMHKSEALRQMGVLRRLARRPS